jgi:signal peptidase I
MTEVTKKAPAPTATAAASRRTGLRSRMADLLLTIGAIAGVLCVLVAIAAFAFQVHLVVFRTGSMSPAIETGALALSRTVPASELAVGDVVTVRSATGQRITHRIQRVTQVGDGAQLVLRGDANRVDDAQPYDVTEADRVIASVPQAGYVVAWLSGPIGIFGGGLLVGLTLLIAFGRGTAPAPDGTPRGVSGVTAAALVLGLGVTMATVVSHRDTLASWTDTAAAATGTLATGSYNLPAAPRITTCTKANGSQGNTIAWTAAASPTTFEVRYTGNAHTAQSVAGTLRTVVLAQGLNGETGTLYLVAITSAGTSPASNLVSYSGSGNNKVCTVG